MAATDGNARWTDAPIWARSQLASRMAAPFGRDLLDAGLKLERGGERAPFDIPDHLARTWDILA
jgi:hypothetical protein